MKIFISWSGDLSRNIAFLLRDWLPNVIQSIEPYVSAKDIEKGAVWFIDISKKLKESDFGLICLTTDNLDSTWIHFESGALANRFDMSRITALLVNVEPKNVKQPLGQFQHTLPKKDDIFALIKTLNTHSGDLALKEQQLRNAFDKWWPDFERGLQRTLEEASKSESEEKNRDPSDILGEVLQISRRTARAIDSLATYAQVGIYDRALGEIDEAGGAASYLARLLSQKVESSHLSSSELNLRDAVIDVLQKLRSKQEKVRIGDVTQELKGSHQYSDIMTELQKMMREGLVSWELGPEEYTPDQAIHVKHSLE